MSGGFVEYPSLTQVAQQCVANIISLIFENLVTPKAGAKHEHFYQAGWFVRLKLELCWTSRWNQIHNNDCCEFGHT